MKKEGIEMNKFDTKTLTHWQNLVKEELLLYSQLNNLHLCNTTKPGSLWNY